MTLKTCAACDCELDADPIQVKIGGSTVEVCCADCARALNEADAATRPAARQAAR
jgi:ribosome-binding protein aMBF1 (putative translation factor)